MSVVIQDNVAYYIPFEFCTREQAAEMLGVSAHSVDRFVREGYKLRSGGKIFIKRFSRGKFKLTDIIKFKNSMNETE